MELTKEQWRLVQPYSYRDLIERVRQNPNPENLMLLASWFEIYGDSRDWDDGAMCWNTFDELGENLYPIDKIIYDEDGEPAMADRRLRIEVIDMRFTNEDKMRGEMVARKLSKKAQTWYYGSDFRILQTDDGRIFCGAIGEEPSEITFDELQATLGQWQDEAGYEPSFAEQLIEIRHSAGMTQTAMSTAMGVPMRTWLHWERGTATPPDWTQRLILEEARRIAEKSKQ